MCRTYAFLGASILHNQFKLDAVPVGGAAMFVLNKDQALLYGVLNEEKDGIYYTEQLNHWWVEVNGWMIDFMAPLYGCLTDIAIDCEPKMMQKPLKDAKTDGGLIKNEGDYCLQPSMELMESGYKHEREFAQEYNFEGLVNQMFVKHPKKLHQRYKGELIKGLGESIEVDLNVCQTKLKGKW